MTASLATPPVPGEAPATTVFAEPAALAVFTALAEAAASALSMPWASITLVEGRRIVLRAPFGFEATGFEATYPELDGAAGSDFAALREPFAVEDVRRDGRLLRVLGRVGPAAARSFVGVPIVAADGRRFGTLCVMDREPRAVSAAATATLRSLAGLAASQLDVHAALFEANAARRTLSTLVDASPVAIATFDLEGRVQSWSPAAERLSGYRAAEVVGGFPPWLPGGRGNRSFRELVSAMRRGASYVHHRARRTHADGTPVDIRISAAPMFAVDGSVMGFVTMSENVDELERAERRLHLFEAALCKASDAVIVTSSLPLQDPEVTWVNEAFTQMFGYEAEEIVGKPLSYLRAPGPSAREGRKIARAHRRRLPTRATMWCRRKNGASFWCEASLSPVVEVDGRCENWVVIARDATEQRRIEGLQQGRSKLLELIAADAPMEEIFTSLVATAEQARPGAGALIRLRRGNVLYRTAVGTALGDALTALDAPVNIGEGDACGRAVLKATQIVVDFARSRSLDDAYLAASGALTSWSSPIRGGMGHVFGTFVMCATSGEPPSDTDLGLGFEFARLAGIAIERHEDRQRLEFLALHDALTGLPNRELLQVRLDAAIDAAKRDGRNVALGLIDLNRFKVINDSLGHAVGDQLLRDVARRLAQNVRPGDTIARLGGDEFVLLMNDLASREEALQIAERVLNALVPSFACAGQEVFVRASMGLSSYPADASDASGLLALGDAAMYEAKTNGHAVAFHVRGDGRRGVARIALEASLNHALANGEFEVLYQPLVELRTREMRGAEALLRWNNPACGLMLPDTFVRVAEDTGLIVPIGAWVLEEACRFARRWQDAGLERFVCVNVSARQFDRPDFISVVEATLAATGLEAGRLHLELTESLVMRSPEKAAATLAELKVLGVKISIDDFGTGYSSFNYLKRFPLDELKIDRLFVRDVGFGGRASNDEAIVRAIVGVARALDLKIVAEGVENEDQVAFLRAIGVPLAQGFLFAPGLRAKAALDWTQAASRRS